MIRVLTLAGAISGAAVLSQYPEFSQQYLQRLAGQVDALTVVVRDFDRSALEAGLGRDEALAEMTGAPFLEARQADMRRTFARHAVLSDNLGTLRAASPLARLAMPQRLADPATFRATLADFAPAAPLTFAGIVAALAGLAAGAMLMATILGLCRLPFRHRPERRDRAAVRTRLHVRGDLPEAAPAPAGRQEPPVARPRPALVAEGPRIPRLMGETR